MKVLFTLAISIFTLSAVSSEAFAARIKSPRKACGPSYWNQEEAVNGCRNLRLGYGRASDGRLYYYCTCESFGTNAADPYWTSNHYADEIRDVIDGWHKCR